MPNYKTCKHCQIKYDEHDSEWIRWCDIPGFCCDDCSRAYEAIEEIGEDEYYRRVDEFEKETNYGEGR